MTSAPNVLAKALYDNIPETPDELGFRKGDIVTVLEQNTQGLEGWWLCSLHGRQGIAPGNRMKLLAGMYDKPFSPTPQGGQPQQQPLYQTPAKAAGYQVPPSHQYQSPPSHQPLYKVPSSGGSYSTPSPFTPYSTPSPHSVYNVPTSHGGFASTYQVPPSSTGYQVPPALTTSPGYGYPAQQTSPGYQVLPTAVREQNYQVPPSLQRQRNSATNISTNKVVTPRRVGQVYHYESPTKLEQETYDTPPQRSQQAALHNRQHSGGPQEFYDTLPKREQRPDIYDSPSKMSSKPPSETYDSPRSNRSSMEILDTYDMPKSNRSSMEILDVYDIPKSDKLAFEPTEVYDVPKSTLGGSELGMTYDTPPRMKRTQRLPSDLEYDVPDSPKKKSMDPEEVYDKPPPPKEAYPQDVYDIPMNNAPAEIYDVPSKDAGVKVMAVPPQKVGHTEDDYDDYVYDVPPQVSRDQPNGTTTFTSSRRSLDEVDSGFNRLSVSTTSSTSSESLTMIPPGKELNLDLHAAMDLLGKLQSEVDYAVSRLLSFVNKDWRKKESMEKNGAEVKTNCLKVKMALGEFIEFAHGAIANSMKAADRSLHKKLSRHLMPLQDTHDALVKTSKALEANDWSMDCMVKNQITTVPDDLDQFVSASRGVPEDVKQLASFIHGNSLLLFKRAKTVAEMAKQQGSPPLSPDADKPALKPKPVWLKRGDSADGETSSKPTRESSKKEVQSRPLPAPPPQEKSSDNDSCIADTEEEENLYENDSKDWMEDYDYVHLQEKEAFERQQRKLLEHQRVEKENMEKDQVHQFEKLEQEVSRPVESHMNNWTPPANLGPTRLCRTDKELLVFYSQQMNSHVTTLLNAIDAFFTCVERSESPKIFVAHSKFVILAAHKLVFVGDTLFRSVEHNDIRNKIMHCSNLLCDTLKMVVGATKTAALQYPSVAALQDMVDRVTEISHASQQLNITVGQAATL